MKSHKKPTKLTRSEMRRVKKMAEFMRTDTVRVQLMEASNAMSQSEGYVAHGEEHAQDVLRIGEHIANQIEALFPGTFSTYDRCCIIATCLMHDVGRSEGGKDHDKTGAKITDKYMLDLAVRKFGSADLLPEPFRKAAVSGVRRHRSDAWLYKDAADKARRMREFEDSYMPVLILADKLSGSETRVDHKKLDLMANCARVKPGKEIRQRFNLDDNWTAARINWGNPELITEDPKLLEHVMTLLADKGIVIPDDVEIDAHDRVNGAIQERRIHILADERIDDGKPESAKRQVKGTMKYVIKVEERFAPHELVTGLDWWHDALHVAAKAAKSLGLRFHIVFNGRDLIYDKSVRNWQFVDSIKA